MILQIRLNLDIFTVWKKLKNSVVKCDKTFSLTESVKACKNLKFTHPLLSKVKCRYIRHKLKNLYYGGYDR